MSNSTNYMEGKYKPIYIGDDELKEIVGAKHLYPPEYDGHFSSVLLEASQIKARVKELAQLLREDFAGQRIVLLCILKGAAPFMVHLMDALQEMQQGYDAEFARASSYTGTKSNGNVEWSGLESVEKKYKNRHIVIVEDILDTGTTLSTLTPRLEANLSPKSLTICTLLYKRIAEPKKVEAKYVGFTIPDKFIVGYGLDYNELYRDLSNIFVVSQQGIDFDSTQLPV